MFTLLSPLQEAFPNLLKLIKISLTIAVTSAHCERSFSTLKRVKNYLRTTMSEQRLTDITTLPVERELSGSILLDDVVDAFNSTQNRRMLLS